MNAAAVLHVDGASFGNPGPSGIGFVLRIGDDVIERSKDVGYGTNNQAEYRGLIAGLTEALARGTPVLMVRSDSQLLVKQMTGEYKVKDAKLRLLKAEADELVFRFERVGFEHVRREANARADDLAKQGAEAARSRGVRGTESPGQKGLLE